MEVVGALLFIVVAMLFLFPVVEEYWVYNRTINISEWMMCFGMLLASFLIGYMPYFFDKRVEVKEVISNKLVINSVTIVFDTPVRIMSEETYRPWSIIGSEEYFITKVGQND